MYPSGLERLSGPLADCPDNGELCPILNQPARSNSRLMLRSAADLDLPDNLPGFVYVDESKLSATTEVSAENTPFDWDPDTHRASVDVAEKMGEDLSSPGAGLFTDGRWLSARHVTLSMPCATF